ncbi:MAG: hypothetical protein RIB98_14710 [Acidimicrobiales bacterium]
MPIDEPVRLRLHRRLSELLDAELADAMMESMPPMRWDQLATKDDIDRLDARTERIERTLVDHGERFEQLTKHGDHLENRIDALGERVENRTSALGERLESQIDALGERIENRTNAFGERIDALGERLDAQLHGFSGELALLEGRLSVRYAETTRMIVFAMMTLFVGVVAVMATTLA